MYVHVAHICMHLYTCMYMYMNGTECVLTSWIENGPTNAVQVNQRHSLFKVSQLGAPSSLCPN